MLKVLIVALIIAMSSPVLMQAATSAPLPFASISQAIEQTLQMGSGLCPRSSEPAYRFLIQKNGEDYSLLVSPDKKRFILVELRDGDDSAVWFGEIAEDGTMKVRQTLSYAEVVAKNESPCDYLVPNTI